LTLPDKDISLPQLQSTVVSNESRRSRRPRDLAYFTLLQLILLYTITDYSTLNSLARYNKQSNPSIVGKFIKIGLHGPKTGSKF
jgi:hypothetical protein